MGEFFYNKRKIFFSKKKIVSLSFLLYLAFIFFTATNIYSQVVIKEKVDVNPQALNSQQLSTQNSTSKLLLEVFWSPSTAPVGIGIISYPCEAPPVAEAVTGGYNSLLIENLTPGSYMWQVGSTENFNSGSYRISINDSVVMQSSFDFISGTYGYTFTNIVYEVKIYNVFLSSIESNQLCFNRYTGIQMSAGWDGCGTISFNALTEPVHLNIIEGSEYVSLYEGWNLLGDSYTGYWQPGSEIARLKVDEYYSGSIAKPVIVEAQWGSIVLYDTSYIPASNAFSIETYLSEVSDTIEYNTNLRVLVDPASDAECYPFYADPNITYKIEILNGEKYADLVDFFTGEETKTLTEYYAEYGLTAFYVRTNGNLPPDIFPVTIKITASDSLVDPKILTIYFKPPLIYVYTDPAVVGVGDTALVNIKKRNSDGSFEDFPQEQTFELAVEDGCINGNILMGDSLGVYFSNAQQPIYFVAADSAESDSAVVKLRVGTDLGNTTKNPLIRISETDEKLIKEQMELAELKSGYEKIIAEKRAKSMTKANENISLSTEAALVNSCYAGGYAYQTDYWEGYVVVKQDECSFWACVDNFETYNGEIGLQTVNQSYNGINYCAFSYANVIPPAAGIFKPLFDEEWPNSISDKIKDQLLIDFNLDVCYDTNSSYWKYQIPGNEVFLRAIIDVCEDNILSSSSEFIIHNTDELSIIPDLEVCLALENFEDQRLYGGGGKYYLIAPVWAHEEIHKANFEHMINKVLNMKKEYFGKLYSYRDLLSNVFQPECDIITNDENKARYRIRKYLDDILSSFITKLREQYKKAMANEDNETNTQEHSDVQWKITEYKKALQNNRPKELWQNCPYKE